MRFIAYEVTGELYWNRKLGINKRAHDDTRLGEGESVGEMCGSTAIRGCEMRSELMIENFLAPRAILGSRMGLVGVGPVYI